MISKALDLLKQGKTGSFKMPQDQVLVVAKNAIVVRYFESQEVKQTVLAAKINNKIVGNSSELTGLIFFRNNNTTNKVTSEQTFLSEQVPMIPFNALKQAGLSLDTFREIDKGQEETIYRKQVQDWLSPAAVETIKSDKRIRALVSKSIKNYKSEERFHITYELAQHFTGASLFQVGDKRFLLDVDRIELKHGIINPFLVELKNNTVNTIAEAYQSLKPQEVVEAEAQGLKVKRQGEWFFIPIDNLYQTTVKFAHKRLVTTQEADQNFRGNVGAGELRAGPNRPNRAECMVEIAGKFYVSGTISHTGREHADLELKEFYQAIPNTSQTSWTITGDID